MARTNKVDTNKKALLGALETSLGVVTSACAACNISRTTFYKYYNNDTDFAKEVESMQEVALDFAESSLFDQIKNNIPSSTIFYLKTKGKKRGYIEEKHIKGSLSVNTKQKLMSADPALLDALIDSMEDDDA